MIVTYKTLSRIKFPIYRLPSTNWNLIDGLLFVDSIIVDDRNMPGDTLGKRRLQSPMNDLLPLNRQLLDIIGIVKQRNNIFIDSYGTPFIYQKTISCPLKYLRIKKINKKVTACILHLHGIKNTFTIKRPPHTTMEYAGILYLRGYPWMLYEYSETPKKETRRMI